ncbi:prenyltransferase/squalene oxidase repeat-containing protein [Urbifossiella limnaea]|uniref:Prenyltransferase and squalene oxidase repeat protein n=1 Tax=Urbifossiella limnaea TaxID=2528023 RepID=A0A517XZA1_9BACT|nr:prenyltransferase/squalene oxidase repeat-containing protein [Urbifossiella limnaea]QDU22840.1 Prenyltransferase and squalene oxidase repeat protein [Urbifossiella limnaea]
MSPSVALLALVVAQPPAPRADTAAAVAYLVKRQSPDGAWRSDVYAAFKDGTALTPLVLGALQDADAAPAAREKALAFLDTFVKDGEVREPDGGFDYPVYTAALALKALCHADGVTRAAAKAAWTKYLLARQLTHELGWTADDPHYGGWGYCRVVPKKPGATGFAPLFTESNLSATLFALEALTSAGALTDARAAAAFAFLRRCQNADGGFHFVHADPVRNKAGLIDGVGVSYGSATADGLRALLLCRRGAHATDVDRRTTRAADWLRTNFQAERHPGPYPAALEPNRNAVYFYYAASVARAYRAANLGEPAGLAAALARKQRADGSWVNEVELVRENDPVVATSQALSARAAVRGPGR